MDFLLAPEKVSWYNHESVKNECGGENVANIKSAMKRIEVTKRNTARNRVMKSEVKNVLRKFRENLEAGKLDEAKDLLKLVDKKLKKAVKVGVIHKNKASRTMSRMQQLLNKAS